MNPAPIVAALLLVFAIAVTIEPRFADPVAVAGVCVVGAIGWAIVAREVP